MIATRRLGRRLGPAVTTVLLMAPSAIVPPRADAGQLFADASRRTQGGATRVYEAQEEVALADVTVTIPFIVPDLSGLTLPDETGISIAVSADFGEHDVTGTLIRVVAFRYDAGGERSLVSRGNQRARSRFDTRVRVGADVPEDLAEGDVIEVRITYESGETALAAGDTVVYYLDWDILWDDPEFAVEAPQPRDLQLTGAALSGGERVVMRTTRKAPLTGFQRTLVSSVPDLSEVTTDDASMRLGFSFTNLIRNDRDVVLKVVTIWRAADGTRTVLDRFRRFMRPGTIGFTFFEIDYPAGIAGGDTIEFKFVVLEGRSDRSDRLFGFAGDWELSWTP